MKFINLTAHTINEVTTGTDIAPSGVIARVSQSNEVVSRYNGMPVYKTSFGTLEGLPEAKENTVYIISSMALNAVPTSRTDVVAPGSLKRDEKGQPIGCVGFRIK